MAKPSSADSQYTRDVLLASGTPRCHAYLVESIKALGAKLRYDHASPVTIRDNSLDTVTY